VRFLIDNNLSPVLAEIMRAAEHDVSHVREIGLQAAADELVLARAQAEKHVVVSADTDFGTLL
jgi:predicted nuclease of predicted toxin-antitoxin system